MNAEAINDLIHAMEAACTVPTVPSRPLIKLVDALYRLSPDILDNLSDDHPLLAAIDAAENLCGDYSFWPPDAYGSEEATVSPEYVMTLQEAVAVLKESLS